MKASGMRGDRSRDEDGELRRKRDDTLLRSLEKEYDVDFGRRGDMQLGTLRKETGLDDVKDIIDQARYN
jgi:hypothetical protein